MTAVHGARLLAGLLAVLPALAAPTAAARSAPPAAVPAAAPAVAADPAGAWAHFLRTASLEAAYDAYDVLPEVAYGAEGVDPEACRTHADALRAAVAVAPVGIGLRHAALLCAEAIGDDAWASAEVAALAALTRHAFAQAGEVRTGRPIPILAPTDAYSLLRAAGLEFLYEFYDRSLPARFFPLTVAAWDEEAGRERHLRFDFIDVTNAILHGDTYSGTPYQRNALTEAILSGHRESGDLAALDIAAASAAAGAGAPLEKARILRPVAAQGGIQSASTWLVACAGDAPAGCADGLVESLLPQAEAQHAIPMVLLAFAYGEGIGTEASTDMAARLLDAAAERWPGHGAVVQYTGLLRLAGETGTPDWLAPRLAAALAADDPAARLAWLAQQHGVEGATLSDADRAFLASPVANSLGEGFGLLAAAAYAADDEATGRQWLQRAADAGHAAMEAILAFELLEEADGDAARAALLPRFESAAHGGDASAARYVSATAADAGDWEAAKSWLLSAAEAGDIDALLQLAWILEADRAGSPAELPRALEIYRALAAREDGAEARRRLARLALEDNAMPEGADEARAWLLADAERGDAESQATLGLSILQGAFGAPDREEAERWLLPAIEAGNELAIVDYGAWLYYRDKTTADRKRALGIWRQGADAGLLTPANNLAWALCTATDPAIIAPARGLAIALAMDEAHELGPGEVDTVAACHAATGDFAAAARVQREALDTLATMTANASDPATVEALEATTTEMQARLAGYLAGEPYIEQDAPEAASP